MAACRSIPPSATTDERRKRVETTPRGFAGAAAAAPATRPTSGLAAVVAEPRRTAVAAAVSPTADDAGCIGGEERGAEELPVAIQAAVFERLRAVGQALAPLGHAPARHQILFGGVDPALQRLLVTDAGDGRARAFPLPRP